MPREIDGIKYVTVPEIAELFNRSRFAARRWVTEGMFPNALDFGEGMNPRWLVPMGDLTLFTPPGDIPGTPGWSARDKTRDSNVS